MKTKNITILLSIVILTASCNEVKNEQSEEKLESKIKMEQPLTNSAFSDAHKSINSDGGENKIDISQNNEVYDLNKRRKNFLQDVDRIEQEPTEEPVLHKDYSNILNIISEFEPNSPEYFKALAKVWNGATIGQLQTELISDEKDIKKGLRLPLEVVKAVNLIYTEDNLFTDNDSDLKVYRIMRIVTMIDSIYGGQLSPSLAESRFDSLPVNEFDLFVMRALLLSGKELNPNSSSIDFIPVMENWLPLTNAKNPVYRLLAVKILPYTVPQKYVHLSSEDPLYNELVQREMLIFLKNYKNETDPLILEEVMSWLKRDKSDEAKQFLNSFKN